jgi:hypothetical protein
LLAAAVAFGLYMRTLARFGEFGYGPLFAVAAQQLGVPHPTGYPLYTLLAGMFVRIVPVGSVIFRTAMLSAFLSAMAVGVVYQIAFGLLKRRWAALWTALIFAVSEAFWASAVVTEVHPLNTLLLAGMLAMLLLWDRTRLPSHLRAAVFLYGLSLANSLIALTWLPLLLIAMLRSTHRDAVRRDLRALAGLGMVPLLLYAYLPLAAWRDPVLNWGDVRSVGRLLVHVTDWPVWSRLSEVTWEMRLSTFVNYLGLPEEDVRDGFLLSQFGAALILLAPVGMWALWRRRRSAFVLLLTAYLCPVLWTVFAAVSEPGPHYQMSHLVVALWIGAGLRQVAHLLALLARKAIRERKGRTRFRRWVEVGVLVLPTMAMAGNFRTVDRSESRLMREMGRAILERPETGSVLIMSGRPWALPALYAQQVEGRRRDLVLLLEPFFRGPSYRLITRERSKGLIVREPDCHHAPGERAERTHGWCRIHQFIWDNYAVRPVYVAGPLVDFIETTPEARDRLPAYRRIVGHEPYIVFLKPDPTAAPIAIPKPPHLLRFRLFEPEAGQHHHHDHEHEH